MTKIQACLKAKRLSIQYGVWYVREVKPGAFEPWAHSSDDAQTVACYISGKEFIEEEFIEAE